MSKVLRAKKKKKATLAKSPDWRFTSRLCFSILVQTIGNESILVCSGSGRKKRKNNLKLIADTMSVRQEIQ